MVLDTSAVVAILCGESGCDPLKEAIARDRIRLMSVASALEASMVLENRYGDAGAGELDLVIQRLPIQLRAVDREQVEWARHAFRTYGRGRHRAGLNFGDCFSYALAKSTGEALLYVGDDFATTDVGNALEE